MEDGQCVVVDVCLNGNRKVATQSTCFCGADTCRSGEYCNLETETCHDKPANCDDMNRLVATNYVCMCNTEICGVGQYCDGSTCHDNKTPCADTTGTSQTEQACSCANSLTVDCKAGEYCEATEGTPRCLEKKMCSSLTGTVADSNDCTCDQRSGLVCDSTQYCYSEDRNFRRVVPVGASVRLCADIDSKVVDDPEDNNFYQKKMATIVECAAYCKSRTDTTGKSYRGFRHEHGDTETHAKIRGMCYCTTEEWGSEGCNDDNNKIQMGDYYQFDYTGSTEKESACLNAPVCSSFNGLKKTNKTCLCDDNMCAAETYCNQGTCQLVPADCEDAFGLSKITDECTCNGITCAPGENGNNKYCHRNVCGSEASTDFMVIQLSDCDNALLLESY